MERGRTAPIAKAYGVTPAEEVRLAEFLAFLEKSDAAAALPPYALDLARLEWATLDTAYTFQEVHRADVAAVLAVRYVVDGEGAAQALAEDDDAVRIDVGPLDKEPHRRIDVESRSVLKKIVSFAKLNIERAEFGENAQAGPDFPDMPDV